MKSTISKAVFLDRDGTLNRAVIRDSRPYAPQTVAELELVDGAAVSLRLLKKAGFALVVVTNQPDVARGTQTVANVEAINARLMELLPLDDIVVCYDDGDTQRRKPNPGMLLEAAAKHSIDLSRSFMVGDRWKDVEAGRRAGCRTVFIDSKYAEVKPDPPADCTVTSLAQAADWILEQSKEPKMPTLSELKIKIFADGADKAGMLEMYKNPLIKGFTTNPTLMRKAGVSDYEAFARDILGVINDRPISFEVFSDEFDQMRRQALKIAAWGPNVYVKIPITNTRGQPSIPLVKDLSHAGVKLNVTAILPVQQVRDAAEALAGGAPSVVSVFAGRIADAGVDPVPLMAEAKRYTRPHKTIELLWASPRELLNILQADAVGCDIITVTNDILKKLPTVGKDLAQFSLDTVKLFHEDATKAGYTL
ncbi:MAG: transaldolase [Phycisphaerae bacterium]